MTPKMKDSFVRHRDDASYVDEIRIETVSRYKTSGLSGDEWRISAVMKFYRKGELLWQGTFGDVSSAANALPYFMMTARLGEHGEFKFLNNDDILCFQPGCAERSTVIYALKSQFSREGYEKKVDQDFMRYCRGFCDKHKKRGDCGLEDADSNYILISGVR